MAATIGQKHKNGFKIVEIWDNHSESLKNNLYNDFKGPEHLLGGMNLENEIDTCQTTVQRPDVLICFLLASRRSDRAKRLKQNNKSYSAQLLTAAGRCKNLKLIFRGCGS